MVFVFDPHSGVMNFQREEVTFDAPFQLLCMYPKSKFI